MKRILLLLAFLVSGASALVYQVVWTRQVELVVTGARSTNWRWGEPRLAIQQAGRR